MGCNTNDRAPTMAELIEEQLVHLRGMRYADGFVDGGPSVAVDVEEWVSDGGNFEGLDFDDDTHREACSFAFGYLRGAAEMQDVTLGELLDAHGLSWSSMSVASANLSTMTEGNS